MRKNRIHFIASRLGLHALGSLRYAFPIIGSEKYFWDCFKTKIRFCERSKKIFKNFLLQLIRLRAVFFSKSQLNFIISRARVSSNRLLIPKIIPSIGCFAKVSSMNFSHDFGPAGISAAVIPHRGQLNGRRRERGFRRDGLRKRLHHGDFARRLSRRGGRQCRLRVL